MLRFSRDGESSNGAVKSRHVHRLDVVGNRQHHVRTGHPNTGRTLLAETLKSAHQLIDVGFDFRLLKVDRFVPRLVGRGIGHEGVATGTEGERRALCVCQDKEW